MTLKCCGKEMEAISVGTRFESKKTYAYQCDKCKSLIPPKPRCIPDDEYELIYQDWERRQNKSSSKEVEEISLTCDFGHARDLYWKIIPGNERRNGWGYCIQCKRIRANERREAIRELQKKKDEEWKEQHPTESSRRSFQYRQNRDAELARRRERDRQRKETHAATQSH